MKLKNWDEFLALSADSGRADFDKYLENSGIPTCELRCRRPSVCCRDVNVSVQSFSPFKKTNPNMRMMTYAGLKLLAYLCRLGNKVYPFDSFGAGVSRMYEVYPSQDWREVGLKGSKNLAHITGQDFWMKRGRGRFLGETMPLSPYN